MKKFGQGMAVFWVFWLGLSGSFAYADEPRPFFNELSLHGGGVYFNGRNGAGVVGGSFGTGIDFGGAGFEFLFKILYGPTAFGAGAIAGNPYLGMDLGLRINVYRNKMAFKFGPLIGAGGTRSGGGSTLGIGPTVGVFYQSSRTYPVYVGYGVEAQALVSMGYTSNKTPSVSGLASVFLGVRMTLLEKILSRLFR